MKKDKTNVVVAVIIILISFLGLPSLLKNFIYIISALIVLVPALQDLQKAYKAGLLEAKDAFVESKPPEKKLEDSPSHIADA